MVLSPRSQQLYDQAEKQRKLCRDWLLYLMTQSSEKPATKEALRKEAMTRWGVSKSAFDGGWISAIEQTGNHHWYDLSPRQKAEKHRSKK